MLKISFLALHSGYKSVLMNKKEIIHDIAHGFNR